MDDVEEADTIRKFDYNEYDDENPITMEIDPVDDMSSVSVQSIPKIDENSENKLVNITLIPDNTEPIPSTPVHTPTTVSTLSDAEST